MAKKKQDDKAAVLGIINTCVLCVLTAYEDSLYASKDARFIDAGNKVSRMRSEIASMLEIFYPPSETTDTPKTKQHLRLVASK